MKKLFITPELFYGYYLPSSLKLIQIIDIFKTKYTDYLMSNQNNE